MWMFQNQISKQMIWLVTSVFINHDGYTISQIWLYSETNMVPQKLWSGRNISPNGYITHPCNVYVNCIAWQSHWVFSFSIWLSLDQMSSIAPRKHHWWSIRRRSIRRGNHYAEYFSCMHKMNGKCLTGETFCQYIVFISIHVSQIPFNVHILSYMYAWWITQCFRKSEICHCFVVVLTQFDTVYHSILLYKLLYHYGVQRSSTTLILW